MGRREGYDLKFRGGVHWLTIYENAGETLLTISEDGTLTDMSGEAIVSSDVTITIMALRNNGLDRLARRVQTWWRANS